jgi:alkanesulfonate monooxygenase SsuD/methylene tetrahydromethanopterin reductase-like flavin-dependent oxidoreductase (luciferase family)
MTMRHGIVVNAGGPRDLVDLAVRAEEAGWDGVFTYDAIAIGAEDMYDPWALLAAMAVRTSRVRLGAMVFAPTRRRPWKVAREAMTIDHLSGGRLIVPVGLGTLDDRGFGAVGETTGLRDRADILDETLAILDGLWSGEPFAHHGTHYSLEPMTFRPRPIQVPRIPVWVVAVAAGERSIARAAAWDGLVLQTEDAGEIRAIAARVRTARLATGADTPFDIVAQGTTPSDAPAAAAIVRRLADAGATWWIEAEWSGATPASVRARIDAGPARVS